MILYLYEFMKIKILVNWGWGLFGIFFLLKYDLLLLIYIVVCNFCINFNFFRCGLRYSKKVLFVYN